MDTHVASWAPPHVPAPTQPGHPLVPEPVAPLMPPAPHRRHRYRAVLVVRLERPGLAVADSATLAGQQVPVGRAAVVAGGAGSVEQAGEAAAEGFPAGALRVG